MIVSMRGYPVSSLLDVRIVCETMGVPLGNVRKVTPKFQRFLPSRRLYFGPLRVIYTSDFAFLADYVEHLETSKKYRYFIVVSGAPSALQEQGIEISKFPFSNRTLLHALLSNKTSTFDRLLAEPRNLAKEIFDKVNRDSLLSKLQSSIYRVTDKVERDRAQTICYAYLASLVKRRPDSGFEFLNNILDSDLATLFCKATKEVKTGQNIDVVAEKFGLDRFEIAYILKRTGYDFE